MRKIKTSVNYSIKKIILKTAILFFCAIPTLSQANKQAAIKIYLTDAETGKAVKNARVTLEGFQIPPIEGNYDKKGKYYYFTEIPTGYNTVMSYHKDYNEKGFQNTDGLPKEVRLKLYDPLNVSYEISSFHDSMYIQHRNRYISSKYFRDIYIEDPYKIAITTLIEDCDELLKLIKGFGLDLEPINPYSIDLTYQCDSIYVNPAYNYPITEGCSALKSKEHFYSPVIFFKKRNGEKFKRFNDPIIAKLRGDQFFVQTVVYSKTAYRETKRFKIKKYKTDNLNSYFDRYNFGLISIEYKKYFETDNDFFDSKLISVESLGLGVLDQCEYFFKYYGIKKYDIPIDYIFINYTNSTYLKR